MPDFQDWNDSSRLILYPIQNFKMYTHKCLHISEHGTEKSKQERINEKENTYGSHMYLSYTAKVILSPVKLISLNQSSSKQMRVIYLKATVSEGPTLLPQITSVYVFMVSILIVTPDFQSHEEPDSQL